MMQKNALACFTEDGLTANTYPVVLWRAMILRVGTKSEWWCLGRRAVRKGGARLSCWNWGATRVQPHAAARGQIFIHTHLAHNEAFVIHRPCSSRRQRDQSHGAAAHYQVGEYTCVISHVVTADV